MLKILKLRNTVLAHILLFIANLIYAINYTVAKDVMPNYIEPSGFILLRVTGAAALFAVSYLLIVKEKVDKKDLFRLAICGLFGIAINQLLFFEGLNLTTPINAAIIMTLTPVLVVALSILILQERLNFKINIGLLIGFSGASTLILNSGNSSLLNDFTVGNAFILINATSYALYLVLIKPLMEKYHPITIMFFVFSFGLLFVFPFGYVELSEVVWASIPKKIIWEIFFVVICTTFIAYLFNSTALKYLTPATVSIYIYLQPLLATIIAILFSSDSLDVIKIISIFMIFIGVYLVSVKSNNECKQKLS